MSEFSVRSDSVDVEQIMRQIRARIREKRGADYTEAELQQLANVKLEQFLDPRGLRSTLVEQFRQHRVVSEAPPNYAFEDSTMYETHRGLLRTIRRLLNPILKLFINPQPVANALHIQAKVNEEFHRRFRQREEMDPLFYEVIHNLVVEVTRLGIEVHNLKMRVESVSSRLDFDERRARSLESVVQYRDRPRRDRDRDRDRDRGGARPRPEDTAAASEPAPAPAVATPPTDADAGFEVAAGGEAARPGRPDEAGTGERRRRRRRRRRRPGSTLGDHQADAAEGGDHQADAAEGGDHQADAAEGGDHQADAAEGDRQADAADGGDHHTEAGPDVQVAPEEASLGATREEGSPSPATPRVPGSAGAAASLHTGPHPVTDGAAGGDAASGTGAPGTDTPGDSGASDQ